jgi:adenylate cyclase
MPTEQKTIRQLRAILSADVKGYSLLMADNEAQTIQTLKAYRQIMFDLISQYSGRVIDSPGDNLLAEFGSAVNAVECAVEVQKVLKRKNEYLSDDKKLEFRIGINIGDVVQDEDRIYGSGVNIAARIEGIADPAGICISRNAYDHVNDKLELKFEYLGEHEVKNIREPVRVYKVLMGFESPARFAEKPLVLPDKPSIAVLPFDNITGDSTKEFFSDGLTEEIITGLSKIPDLFVIARNSTFTYKGKAVKVQQVSRELGVMYVLEGSVRTAGETVRITTQLIDGTSGQHLWAERYDRYLNDIFAIQDDITMKIMIALQVKLREGETARLRAKGTDNIDAYSKYLQAGAFFIEFNKDSNILARQKFEEVIDLEPEYAAAYGGLAGTYMVAAWVGWDESPEQCLLKAFEYSQKCLAMDDSNAWGHAMMGAVCLVMRQWEKAIEEGEYAVALSPNSADILALFAMTLRNVGRVDEALMFIQKAIRLNPMTPEWYLHELGTYYRLQGRYEEAIAILKKNTESNPYYLMSRINLTATYSMAGKLDQARAEAKEVLKKIPDFSAEQFMKGFPYKDQKIVDDFIENLCKAGLPA